VTAPVVLLTDFGLDDVYVGELKAALLAQWERWPRERGRPAVVDLSHGVPAGDVAAGAWLLERAAPRFPAGSVFVAVVDPGVGTARPAVAVRAHGRISVAPGNGLLAHLADAPDVEAVTLNPGFAARATGAAPSATFHGRDLFAVAAAHLAMGAPLRLVGEPARADVLGAPPRPAPGRVVWIDRFGNAVSDVPAPTQPTARVLLNGRPVAGPYRTFGEAPADVPFWYAGSGGCVEFAVRDAHGAERHGWRSGLAVAVEIP